MFEMIPPMGFGRRLSVWWSCTWRELLVGVPIWVVVLILSLIVASRHEGTLYLTIVSLVTAILVSVPIAWILCVPLVGYMVNKGFKAHALDAPSRIGFGQAFMVGLTTAGWTALCSIPGVLVMLLFQHIGYLHAGNAVNLLIEVLWALYIVLPRQARRLRLIAGAHG